MIDVVKVNALGTPNQGDVFDFNFQDWTSLQIKSSMVQPSECSFELGDETGWARISALCGLGALFVVMVDDRPRLTGRVEALSSSLDANQSATQSFVIRTRLSDAAYSTAPQGLHLKRASIKDFVLACYAVVGLKEADFDFRVDVSRDLMTGKTTRGGKTVKSPRELAALTEEQAKVNPPETVFAAVDRHLRRHGMLHWDGPDGRIVVGSPDDTQEPIASLRSHKAPNGQHNNIISITRTQDVSQSPTVLGVFGVGGGKDFARTKVASPLLYNDDLIARGFQRRALIIDEGIKTKGIASSRANREFATRNRSLDRLDVTVDGLSYRDGPALLPWAPDTTIDVVVEGFGGALGKYYVEDVELTRNARDGDLTKLSLVRSGVWVL